MLVKRLCSSGLALGLVVSVCFPAHADLLTNFKTDGSIETRSFSIDNETDRNANTDDYRAQTNYRIMVGGSFDLLSDVHARIQLDKNALQGSGSGTITSVQGTTFFDNAYVKIDKVFGAVDFTIGRQFYGDPNDLVIYFGPQDDAILSITSLDAFRADADIMGWAKFHGIAGKIADLGTGGVGANSDTDVWGGELGTDKVIPKGNLAAYYYTLQVKKAAAPATPNNDTLIVYGARANGDIPVVDGLGYGAEFILNAGRDNKDFLGVAAPNTTPAYDGDAYFGNLHYGHDLASMPARAHIEYGRGTSNFSTIAAGRRFGLIWGEMTDQAADPSNLNGVGGAGLSNLHVFDGGIGINPIAKLGLDLNAYRFTYSANGVASYSAGSEYDFIVSWKHSDNVSFDVNAATFQVGQALQNASPTPTNPITRLGADVKIKF